MIMTKPKWIFPKRWEKTIKKVVVLVLIATILCEVFHSQWRATRETFALTSAPLQEKLFATSSSSKQSHQSKLPPPRYRVADKQSCRPPIFNWNAQLMKTTTHRDNDKDKVFPKVPHDLAVQLALGGYRNILKGSGDIPQTGPLLMILSRIQFEQLALTGSVGELGVHQGRFTSFLFVTARQNEDLVVADLFEDLQELNVDHSGSGHKQKFLKGLQTYGLSETDLHTVHTGSTEDLPFDWAAQSGFAPFRLVSVDAGHTARLAYNDLQVAFCNTLPGGIVILDDFFHGAWPGVSEAFFRLLWKGPSALADMTIFPFLACKSKLFITNDMEAYELYYSELSKATSLVKPRAYDKSMNYELNGVQYLQCKTQIEDESVQKLWASLIL